MSGDTYVGIVQILPAPPPHNKKGEKHGQMQRAKGRWTSPESPRRGTGQAGRQGESEAGAGAGRQAGRCLPGTFDTTGTWPIRLISAIFQLYDGY